jgi:nitrogen fixation protein NifU and related proteins
MDLYAQNILDRFKSPFHKDKKVAVSLCNKEANYSCGDSVEVTLELVGDKIKHYSFSGAGCAISQASADILGDLVEGKTLDEVVAMGKDELFEALGIEISLRRSQCALLALLTLQNAILKSRKESLRSWNHFNL